MDKLSAQELRLRRLAALGIIEAQNIDASSVIEQIAHKTDSNAVSKVDNKQRIIDLLDSDSDGDIQQKESSAVDKKESSNIGAGRKRRRTDVEALSGGDKMSAFDSKKEQENSDSNGKSQGREWNFKVATWNVWFGPQGDGQPHPGPRMRAIVRLLKEQGTADVPLLFIGLQEVIDPLAHYLIPALEAAGYCIYRQKGAPYGCAVAIDKRLQIVSKSWNPYSNTVMSRGYYQVRAKLPNKNSPDNCPEVVFTTTHLESYSGSQYTGAKERPQQLLEVEQFCNKQVSSKTNPASMAIITGDMNWDDERARSTSKPSDPLMSNTLQAQGQWQDSWLVAACNKIGSSKQKLSEGYTYDAKLNPMLGGHLRRRFDRCLVRSSDRPARRSLASLNDDVACRSNNDDNVLVAETIKTIMIGQDAIPDLTWEKKNIYNGSFKETPTAPSDHFGLVATIRLSYQDYSLSSNEK